jgi:hypothetical protein
MEYREGRAQVSMIRPSSGVTGCSDIRAAQAMVEEASAVLLPV